MTHAEAKRAALRSLRTGYARMSLGVLAAKMNVAPQTILRWETTHSLPDDRVDEYLAAVGVSADIFVEIMTAYRKEGER